MKSFKQIREPINDRFSFIQILSEQFVAMTGYGVYVYLSPDDVETLFNRYQNENSPIRIFVRCCVKSTLKAY